MSETPPDDPFLAEDPAAVERERRRREREQRRLQRSDRGGEGARKSLAERVGGALESAAERGREVVGGLGAPDADGDRAGPAEPARDAPQVPDADGDGAVAGPPGGHHVPADPPTDQDGFVDRPATDEHAFAEHPTTDRRALTDPATDDHGLVDPATDDHRFGEPLTDDHDLADPLADEHALSHPATGEHRRPERPAIPARPRAGGAGEGGSDVYWRRRIAAAGAGIGAILLLVAVVVLAGRGGEEPAPVAEPEPIATTDVVVPEGLTLEQMADVADEAGLRGNYVRAARRAADDFNLRRYGAEDAPSLEGFLFPATYEVERRAPAGDLVERQLEAFDQNISQVDMGKAERRNLTVYDVVKIASMIEREVSIDEERRLASAVIHNRLADGEPLGIDATLRYDLDKFDGQLLQSELDSDTLYNTRIHAGLPPTPIANPGLASLEAAADPANRDFRYYVIKPGTCNEHLFTADAAEFEAAQAEYQAALQAEGGSPTEC